MPRYGGPKLRNPCRHYLERYFITLTEFPIEKVIREILIFVIIYLSSDRKGWCVRYPVWAACPRGLIPWPGQLAPTPSTPPPPHHHPPTLHNPLVPGKLANRSEKIFHQFKRIFRMHQHLNGSNTCFYVFFSLQECITAKILQSKQFPPNLVIPRKRKHSSVRPFIAFKTISH